MEILLGILVVALAVSPWLLVREINAHHHRLLLRSDQRVDVLEDKLLYMAGKPVLQQSTESDPGGLSFPLFGEPSEEEKALIEEGFREV